MTGSDVVPLTGQVRGAFSPEARFMATAARDGSILYWDLADKIRSLGSLKGTHGGVTAFGISPDGRFLASGSADFIKLWDLSKPAEEPALLHGFAHGRTSGLYFSPDAIWLASTASNDSALVVWDLRNGAAAFLFYSSVAILNCAWRADGRAIAACDASGRIYLLEPYKLGGQRVPDFPLIVTPWRCPDTNKLAFGCPACREWSEIGEAPLGTTSKCPLCSTQIEFTRTIDADWRSIKAAWRSLPH
jgi:WD40 repeat protein